jgi:hydrogenase maturation factor HypF (carbamoyltransferase family)
MERPDAPVAPSVFSRCSLPPWALVSREFQENPWPIEIDGNRVLLGPVVEGVLSDLLSGTSTEYVASRLHATVACIAARLALHAGDAIGGDLPWALSGGVFQNRAVVRRLRALPQTHARVLHLARVPGDFGLAAGQLAAASHLLRKD